MSLDAIQKVTEAEQSAKARKAQAEIEARKLVSDSQRSGTALIEEARTRAEAENKVLLEQAEVKAAQAAQTILAQAKRDAEAMYHTAESKLDQAADLIVRRVVKQ